MVIAKLLLISRTFAVIINYVCDIIREYNRALQDLQVMLANLEHLGTLSGTPFSRDIVINVLNV